MIMSVHFQNIHNHCNLDYNNYFMDLFNMYVQFIIWLVQINTLHLASYVIMHSIVLYH